MTVYFFIGLGVVSLGGYWAYQAYRCKKVQAVAEQLGFSFHAQSDVLDEIRKFPISNQGTSKKCINCLQGEANGINVRVFEYCYKVRSGKQRVPISHTVAYLTNEAQQFPCFQARPKSFFDRLNQSAGILINPQFDETYIVESVYESATRQLLNTEVTNEVIGRKLCIEADGNGFIVYRHGYTVNHKLLEDFVRDSVRLMLLFRNNAESPSPPESEIIVDADGRLSLAKAGV